MTEVELVLAHTIQVHSDRLGAMAYKKWLISAENLQNALTSGSASRNFNYIQDSFSPLFCNYVSTFTTRFCEQHFFFFILPKHTSILFSWKFLWL